MDEQRFASQVVEWLTIQHWDVYQEVQFFAYSAIADIAAVRNDELIIVEVKKSLSLTVIRQAAMWRSYLRAIAVPETRNRDDRIFAYDICASYLKVGVIEVSKFGSMEWAIDPPPLPNYWDFSKEMIEKLTPGHKTHALAGSSNGGHYTPYRDTMDRVKGFITEHPGCTLKEILDHINKGHYSSIGSARGSIRVALDIHEPWCRVDHSGNVYRYFIRETERDEL